MELQLSCSNAFSTRDKNLLQRFFSIYLPISPSDRGGTTEKWLVWAAEKAKPSQPLHLALRALAVGRVGAVDNNEALVQEGIQLYSEAVGCLGRSLGLSGPDVDNQVVVAALCLMRFEVHNPSSPPFLPFCFRPTTASNMFGYC
jgi:hypothetical protein